MSADIDRMGGREFEYYVTDLYRRQGYEATPTQASGDGGADVIAENGAERVAVECKWRSNAPIGVTTVRELAGVVERDAYDRGAVVTNTRFTDSAYKEANHMPVTLIDGERLRELDADADRFAGRASSGGGLLSAIAGLLVGAASDPDALIDVVRAAVIGLVGLYMVLYLLHALFGTPDPTGFISS